MSPSTVPSRWSGSYPVSASIQSRQKIVSTARPQQKAASGRIKATWETVGLSPVPSVRAFVLRLRVRVVLCGLLDLTFSDRRMNFHVVLR